jgi:hypothetical protein
MYCVYSKTRIKTLKKLLHVSTYRSSSGRILKMHGATIKIRVNRKIGKIVTLHQRELFKKIPRLGTFCTQSVDESLVISAINATCFCPQGQ